ncbi:hypothetical protein PGO37_13820 [Klebsiella aerogenes]
MSRYEDLNTALSALYEHQHQYWRKIEAVYCTIANQYAKYLGVTGVFVDLKGDMISPVVTGTFDPVDNLVKNTPAPLLKKQNKYLFFDIAVSLCESGTTKVAFQYLIKVQMRKDGDEYHLEVPDFKINCVCYEIDSHVDFTDFFEAVQAVMMNKLTPQ